MKKQRIMQCLAVLGLAAAVGVLNLAAAKPRNDSLTRLIGAMAAQASGHSTATTAAARAGGEVIPVAERLSAPARVSWRQVENFKLTRYGFPDLPARTVWLLYADGTQERATCLVDLSGCQPGSAPARKNLVQVFNSLDGAVHWAVLPAN